jgi:WS/DGAT/MGAT family acyltransferase
MTRARLSAFDASFLTVETPTAHMHVGFVATLSAPEGSLPPSFAELRDHIGSRLARAPRYRQKLAPVPLGLHTAEWVDDEAFSVDRHVYRARGPLGDLVDEVMSVPLRRDRPLWEMWICEDSSQEWFAIVGKVHHCMIDGTAAIELTALLLDPTPEPGACEADGWRATPPPSAERLLVRGVRDLVGENLGLLQGSLWAARAPTRAARQTLKGAVRATRAVGHSLRAAPESLLNRPLSPLRSLAWTQRPLADLQLIKRTYGMTVNDVLLAGVAGGMRTYMIRRREEPIALKTMVPVSVRDTREQRPTGNQISFVFVELPCDEAQPLGRLYGVRAAMNQRKRDGAPEGADLFFKAAARTPSGVQRAISRLIASPRTFNLVVSNVPGPRAPLFMLGCPLQSIYPVVPLADHHAVSVGMTTVRDQACFGIYADRQVLPDAGVLARDIDNAFTELLACVDPSISADDLLKPMQITARRLAPLAPLAAEEPSVAENGA